MAQDFQARRVGEGKAIDYTPSGADVAAGQVVVIGAHLGIAPVAIKDGKLGALDIGGLHDVVKVNGVMNDGAALYWDAVGNPQGGVAGTGAATTVSAGNTFLGFAVGAAGATDETVRIDVVGVAAVTNTIQQPLTNVIADPGNGGAIPVTDSGHVDIVTTGAQTRTLAAPTYVGQLLEISMKTDGGDCVITCATTINQTGNTTITLNDAGDAVLLVGKANGANIRWSVVSNDGAALA
jgi:predicted RecA/RadA family phage recombinase